VPLLLFLVGIALAAVSMFLAQKREIMRRDAAERDEATPKFGKLYWSWRWNYSSFIVFLLGVATCLYALATFQLG